MLILLFNLFNVNFTQFLEGGNVRWMEERVSLQMCVFSWLNIATCPQKFLLMVFSTHTQFSRRLNCHNPFQLTQSCVGFYLFRKLTIILNWIVCGNPCYANSKCKHRCWCNRHFLRLNWWQIVESCKWTYQLLQIFALQSKTIKKTRKKNSLYQ